MLLFYRRGGMPQARPRHGKSCTQSWPPWSMTDPEQKVQKENSAMLCTRFVHIAGHNITSLSTASQPSCESASWLSGACVCMFHQLWKVARPALAFLQVRVGAEPASSRGLSPGKSREPKPPYRAGLVITDGRKVPPQNRRQDTTHYRRLTCQLILLYIYIYRQSRYNSATAGSGRASSPRAAVTEVHPKCMQITVTQTAVFWCFLGIPKKC